MNKTRRNLIIAVIVLNFISVASSVVSIIGSVFWLESMYAELGIALTGAELHAMRIQNYIYAGIDMLLYLSAAICLILHLKYHDKNYILSGKLFFAGFILNLLAGILSIENLLLLIAYFKYADIQVINEESDDEIIVEESEDSIKRKIERLRKLKEDGTISEEEFKEEILKLL